MPQTGLQAGDDLEDDAGAHDPECSRGKASPQGRQACRLPHMLQCCPGAPVLTSRGRVQDCLHTGGMLSIWHRWAAVGVQQSAT